MNAIHPVIAHAPSPFTGQMKPKIVSFDLYPPKKPSNPPVDTTHRPTDRELLQALADAYQISPKKAHAWWYAVDFDALSDVLICEMREAS